MAVLLTKYRTIVDFRTEKECHPDYPLNRHPTITHFTGLVKGECMKHMRNTNCKTLLSKQLKFFKEKVIERGYDSTEIQNIIDDVMQYYRDEQ